LAGWALRGVAAPESVADHCYGTALLCLLYAADAGVDRDRAVAIALAHDLAEAVTGDFVARADAADRDVSEDEKAAAERAAMAELVPPAAEEVRALWREYEERATPEAVFVRDMNLLDMCLQALYYEASSRYDASRPVPSSAGYAHLDEFFASARPRLGPPLGLAPAASGGPRSRSRRARGGEHAPRWRGPGRRGRDGGTMLRRLLLVCVAAVLAAASAQALVVYTSVDEENARKLLDAFTADTGIRVQMVFLSSGPALSRIEAERARPQADVWFGAP